MKQHQIISLRRAHRAQAVKQGAWTDQSARQTPHDEAPATRAVPNAAACGPLGRTAALSRFLPDIAATPQLTPARLTEIRREIAAGTYLTDEKLDAAVQRLFEALRDEWPLGAAVG